MQEQLAHELAVEAYIYFYPLVLMELTRRQLTNVDKPTGLAAPMGVFAHARAYPDPSFTSVVRPNFDTLYSTVWVDLSKGPVILTVPDSEGRYHLFPVYDMWTDAVAVPGSRTTGDGGCQFALVGPGFRGKLPDRVVRIDVPTQVVWIIGRIQTNGPEDYPRVHQFQDELRLTPLSKWGKSAGRTKRRRDPTVDMDTPPMKQVEDLGGRRFFGEAVRLWKQHGPHSTDLSQVWRLRRIGIVHGEDLDFDRLEPMVQKALLAAPDTAIRRMQAKVPMIGQLVNGWSIATDKLGVYGNSYLLRASTALIGLGANPPEDAVYPLWVGDTRAGERYTLHFDRADLPPARAFWSVTLYNRDGFPAENPLGRYALGDRDPLVYNQDGSLDMYIQHDSPGESRERNWLPAPAEDGWNLAMRLYSPAPSVLDGRWKPPPVRRGS